MVISTFIVLIIILFIIIAIPIYLIVRSSQKTRREFSQHKQNSSEMAQEHIARPSFAQDAPSIGIAIIGFLLPLVGIIMYIAWLNSLPFRARSAGKGALIGVVVYIVSTAIIIGINLGAFS